MRIFFLAFFTLASLSLTAQDITAKLAAYFSFDDCEAKDDSGNGSSGALIGTTECACGARDSSMRFDSPDDAIYFIGPLSDVFTTGDFSISFYVKPTQQPAGQNASQLIMSKQNACDRNRAFWVRYQSASNIISSSISQNDTLIATVSAKLDRGTCWQHVVLVRDDANYTLYINGSLRATSKSITRLDIASNATFKVGEPVCPLDLAYRGDLDELRLYNRAINQETIDALYLRPDQIANRDTLIYLGNSFQISTTATCAQTFKWTPSTGLSNDSIANPIVTPAGPTVYYLTFSQPGCQARDSIVVDVIDPDTLDCTRIFIPNAFTPGGATNLNNTFGISNPYAVDEFISFEVFDRWGGKVFAATSAFDNWDGTFGSQPANPGVFLYRLRYKCDGVEKVKAGSLTLLR